MDSETNNQMEVAFERAQEGSAEEAANNILGLWESENERKMKSKVRLTLRKQKNQTNQ